MISLQFNLIFGFWCGKSRSMYLFICTSEVHIVRSLNCHWTRSYQKASMSVQLPAIVWHDSPYNSSAFPSYFRSWHAEWPEPSNMQHLWFFSLSRDHRQILLNLQEFEEVLELPRGIEFRWRCETGAWIIVGFLATLLLHRIYFMYWV